MPTTTILKGAAAPAVSELALSDLAHPSRPPRVPVGDPAGEPEAAEVVHETRLEVVRLEGVVQAIEVHCGCGEVTVVELDLTPTPNTPPQPAPSHGAPVEAAHASPPEAQAPAADVPSDDPPSADPA